VRLGEGKMHLRVIPVGAGYCGIKARFLPQGSPSQRLVARDGVVRESGVLRCKGSKSRYFIRVLVLVGR
jgi:hypothetical protein